MSPRLLFVHNRRSTFVQIDLDLLGEKYDVTEWYARKGMPNLAALRQAVANCDILFGWFASWHTFYPVLMANALRRPVILVVGGYDTANMPEIGYGNQRGGLRRLITRRTMQHANQLVTNSSFTRAEAIRNVDVDASRVTVVYHGLVPPSLSSKQKEKFVLTVGDVRQDTLLRKGLIPFVRAAAFVPEVPFVLVGEWRGGAIDALREIAPPNVTFTNRLSAEALDDSMARAQVYVQASAHEGFGMALAEAMLHECVPVVTRAGAIPEVVGDAGFYTPSTEAGALAETIRQGLEACIPKGQDACIGKGHDAGAEWGTRARERIVREFPLARRREGLERVIQAGLNEF